MASKISRMDAELLCAFLRGGCAYLGEHKEEVNALNVFPVPDGDTGINMFLTVNTASGKLPAAAAGMQVGKVAADFAMGTLMGARGNSGVILSQIFRGFSLALNGKNTAAPAEVAAAMQRGVDLSYKSVMKPVEGTILTVYREFAAAAGIYAQKGDDMAEMFRAALAAGKQALARTPELLPVLKEAGVVDAGGQGLLFLMEGGLLAIAGDYVPAPLAAVAPAAAAPAKPQSAAAASEQNIEFAYCTQTLILGHDIPIDKVREHLSHTPPGDSLLVVGDSETVKIHFHNNRPWEVLEYCSRFGELHDIIIDNMREQHHEIQFTVERTEPAEPQPPEPTEHCGVIAVCAGEDMAHLYREIGAEVISGGQTMNPSAEDLLHAVKYCPAEQVVILPNNGNIILAAQQAKALSEKPVEVVASKFVTQGISAMMGFIPANDAAINAAAMEEAGASVINGELTYAVRDTKYNGFEIKTDDVLALLQGKIVGCGKDLPAVLTDLVGQMLAAADSPELLSLYYGENISEAQAQELGATLQERWPDLEIEVRSGGQPLYYFLVSVE